MRIGGKVDVCAVYGNREEEERIGYKTRRIVGSRGGERALPPPPLTMGGRGEGHCRIFLRRRRRRRGGKENFFPLVIARRRRSLTCCCCADGERKGGGGGGDGVSRCEGEEEVENLICEIRNGKK